MSIGPSSIPASIAGIPLQQTVSNERARQQVADQLKQAQARQAAEQSKGIAQTEADAPTSDRDADGRRTWEAPLAAPEQTAHAADDDSPDGASGNQLDLQG